MKIITKDKSNIKYLLFVVGIAIIITGAILHVVTSIEFDEWLINSSPKKEKKVEIDTSGWKTYRDEETGVEFKYPSRFIVDHITIEDNYHSAYFYDPNDNLDIGKCSTCAMPFFTIHFSVSNAPEDARLDLMEYIKKEFSYEYNPSNDFSDATIDDRQAVKYSRLYKNSRYSDYYVVNDGKIYNISSEKSSDYSKILDQILSTFIFLY